MDSSIKCSGFLLQEKPPIYVASISGKWLLNHTTPSWRIKDPKKGFQRVVKEDRVRQIAVSVLEQQRTFPNSIVLATNIKNFKVKGNSLTFDKSSKFLIVDGQHRLWAQHYSKFNAQYSCNIHCNLSEVEMAQLFLEINDNQKRVPSSLRWDLVRLVRPDDDPFSIAAVDLVLAFATNVSSPLYQRIDLTGEQKVISLKQGSIAPEFRYIVSKAGTIKSLSLDEQYDLLEKYIAAVKSLDSKGWLDATSPFYQARILRMLIRLLPEIVKHSQMKAQNMKVSHFKNYLKKIDKVSLSPDNIRAKQGAAGMKEIYDQIKSQIF